MEYSVGIPVRNEVKTIGSCLESILNQTILPSEILVCVNGSNDGTLDLVQKISKNEKKIKVIESKPGKPNAWMKIFNESKNNYLMFIDGDVKINPTGAENLLFEFEKNKHLSIVGGSQYYIKPKKETSFSKFTIDSYEIPIIPHGLTGRIYLQSSKKILEISKKKNIELMPNYIINEDGFLNALAKSENSLKIINSAFAKSQPILNFSDWYITTNRILEGQKQLKKEFDDILGLNFLVEDFKINMVKYYFERFKKVNGFKRKIGLASFFLLRQIIKLKINSQNNLDYNNLWEIPQSTKVPFD